ncbi:MAG TPA: pyridoxine 5'-phosphate synthase [Blastocatellia bacterium]|nr:pyridoxine 5'-phosphate synthase [Blastocatellia bacterium]HMX24827.1 pyridoxine 5'-phosphate synthase [Blastocatellia bacterium]HMY71010.1 pyridoxine 5'-phosphate synthase [Blastocatellia bacterium]HMZ16712.1 pyridoxine 5'-phosphate synthase [Blastocatellia bacterium]HNG32977.1 pyridoxine 5'-phosphate synthase [Blastocatellia bacterium]
MSRLNVNIDHIATIRQARRTNEPNPVSAAVICELAGADGITTHLRSDRRHIQDYDLIALKQVVITHLNVEMAATEEMVEIALRVKPDVVTLVPETPQEITTEGGLDVVANKKAIKSAISKLNDAGIFVSLFIDPDIKQIKASAKTGAFQVELCTAQYAYLNEHPGDATVRKTKAIESEVTRIRAAVKAATQEGLHIAAGHGLTYRNVANIARIEEIEEFNIGHNIIARAALVGLDRAVREMITAIDNARGK